MIFAWSTTRPVSGGKVAAKAPASANNSKDNKAIAGIRPAAIRHPKLANIVRPAARRRSELHLRDGLCVVSGGELDHRLVGSEECRGPTMPGNVRSSVL